MSKNKSAFILYLMVSLPLPLFVKIGITGVGIGKRARSIDKAMRGCLFAFPLPVFFCVVPGAYYIEQMLHRELAPLQRSPYKGDGHTEWFWLPAGIFALAVMLAIWAVWVGLIWWIFSRLK